MLSFIGPPLVITACDLQSQGQTSLPFFLPSAVRSRYIRCRGLTGHSPGHWHPLPVSWKTHTWEHFPFIFVKEKVLKKEWPEGLFVQRLANKDTRCIWVCVLMYAAYLWGKKTCKKKKGKGLNLGIWKTHFPLLYHLSSPFKQAITLTTMYCCSAASPLLPGCMANWSSCYFRICQLLSSKQSKPNTDTRISDSKGAECMLSKNSYDVRSLGTQEDAQSNIYAHDLAGISMS